MSTEAKSRWAKPEPVIRYRRGADRLRQLQLRGGGNGATVSAVERHRTSMVEAQHEMPRELAGLVQAEDSLVRRMAEARREGQQRPELQARLRATRSRIRELV